jgi:hypothetical protein
MKKKILITLLKDDFHLLITSNGLKAGYFKNDSFTKVYAVESFCIHVKDNVGWQKRALDGMPLFDYWSQDFEETTYYEGVHKDFVHFIEENGWYLDWINSDVLACHAQ